MNLPQSVKQPVVLRVGWFMVLMHSILIIDGRCLKSHVEGGPIMADNYRDVLVGPLVPAVASPPASVPTGLISLDMT